MTTRPTSRVRREANRAIRSRKVRRENARLLAILGVIISLAVAGVTMQGGRAMTHEERVLDCPVAADSAVAHAHDESCYDADGNLVCQLPEVEAHIHDDSCYTEERTLVCGLEEGDGAHYHDEGCYDEEGSLVCGLEESDGHVHDDSCYEVTRTLTCEKEEITEVHTHGQGCFRTVVVDDGEVEAGLVEDTENTAAIDDSSDADELDNNQTAYPAQSFQHEFKGADGRLQLSVSVEAPEGALPEGTTMRAEWVDTDANENGDVQAAIEGAVAEKTDNQIDTVQAVDITFLDTEGTELEPQAPVTVTMTSPQIANSASPLVVHVESEREAVERGQELGLSEVQIEGQVVDPLTDGQLAKRDIVAQEDELVFDAQQFSVYAVVYTVDFITASGETYTITVTYGNDAGIPAGAELRVEEILEETDEYDYYCDQAIESLSENASGEGYAVGLNYARFFDVSIVKDGQKIEPIEPVEVKITYSDPVELTHDADLKVVHFAEGGTEIIDIETTGDSVAEIAYEQNGFSVIGTVAETNAYGWPTTVNNPYVMLLQDGDDYYAVGHDGSLRSVYYLNGTVSFMGPGTTSLDYLDNYLWNYSVVSSTRHTARLSTYGTDSINYIDPYYGVLPQNVDTPNAVIGSAQRTLSISDGKVYATYYGTSYTLSAEGGTLHRTTLSAEDASPVHFAEITSFTADSSESEMYDFIDISVLVNKWQAEMTQDLIVDKTAEVYDYANRIYQLDLKASSGYHLISPALALEFVVDASRSMYFPENIYKVQVNGSDYTYSNMNGLRSFFGNNGPADKDTTYYVITDKDDKATNWAVFYHDANKLTVYKNNQPLSSGWYYIDASYYYAPDSYERNYPGTGGWCNPLDTSTLNDLDDGYIYTADEKVEGRPWSRLDYMQIAVEAASRVLFAVDPEAQVGLVTFNKNTYSYGPFTASQTDDLINALYNIALDGGTCHADGLNKAISEFNNEFNNVTNCQTAVVLITDGAPNGNTWNQINTASANVKAMTNAFGQNTQLFSLGLSLENVGQNKDKLANISSEPHSDHAFSAEKSTDVVNFITKIVEGLTIDADLIGSVTDVIDAGFYPVNPDTGMPLESGTWITVEGTVTTAGADDAIGQVNYTDGVWKVEWQNQRIDWPTYTDSTKTEVLYHGWDGRVYVKAQEDFLGGNDISTNGPGSQAEAIKYINRGTGEVKDISGDDAERIKPFDTPYVNVDELLLDENSTEWTVYLGTSVDPKAEIQNLMDAVKVYEVVKDDGSLVYTLSPQSTTNLSSDNKATTGNTFQLSEVIDELTEDNWNNLISGGTIEVDYEAYGHTPGVITLSLTQTVAEGEDDLTPSPHATAVVGEGVEQYELTITYTPFDPAIADYHTGNNGSGSHGANTDPMVSDNTHTINVHAKNLQITKVGLDDQVLTGAKFALYRTVRDGETNDNLTIDERQYHKVAELDTSSTGMAIKNQLEQLNAGEQYYLVETQAPDGYNAIPPIPVTLQLTDVYTPKPGTATQATKPASGMYDWAQNSLIVIDTAGVKRTDANNTQELTHSGGANTDTETIYYRITNNPGVALPSTGGFGTTAIYLLGVALVGLGAASLVMQRRRQAA